MNASGQTDSQAKGTADGSSRYGLILLYHRVTEVPTDPQLLCVRPTRFAEQMRVLREMAAPVRLAELLQGGADGGARRRMAITFDDGYADNLHEAKPILARFEATATVFVVSGAVGSDREFWWDELDWRLLQAGTVPPRLQLTIGGKVVEWDLGGTAKYGVEEWQRDREWNVLSRSGTPRQELYRKLCTLLRPLTHKVREGVLDELAAWAGRPRTGRATHRAMTADELESLTADGLIDVGAHSVTHPILSSLPVAEQEPEIADSKATLERMLGREVSAFSYPYGTRKDYTAETAELVRRTRFARACSNFAGVVQGSVDPFQLPRLLMRDWDEEEFRRRLEEAWGCG